LNIHIPRPESDELDLGFLGRIRRLNDFKDQAETIAALGESLDPTTDPRASHVVPLARSLNMSLGQFTRQHTLDSYHNAYTSEAVSHADTAAQSLYVWYGRRGPITEANFCPDCVHKDETELGFSYWRRSHQLPGVTWCVQHMSALKTASRVHPYNDSPFLLSHSVIRPPYPTEISDVVRQSRVGTKYAEISLQLLERQSSEPLDRVTQTIREGLTTLGVHVGKSRSSRYRTLADLAAEVLPRPWLIQHFSPKGYSRGQDSFVGPLNKTVGYMGSSGVNHYVLAQAILAEYGLDPL
jgi:hypothetical protein